jgi:NADH-quinone oxidoreductase subunit M
MRPAEFLVMLPLLALIVFLGLYPTPMLERMEPSVKALVEHVDLNVDRLTVDEVEYIGPAQAQGEEGE